MRERTLNYSGSQKKEKLEKFLKTRKTGQKPEKREGEKSG